MYYSKQTLVHKETRKLARLCGQDEASNWAWDIGPNTLFIDETGRKFQDHIKDYEPVYDWLDRPIGDNPREGQFVATHLKPYVTATTALRARRQQQYLLDWECYVLHAMKHEEFGVLCPFADGEKSVLFQNFFLEGRGAIALHKSLDGIFKKYNTKYCRQYVFKYEGRLWMYDDQMSSLKRLEPLHMLSVAQTLLSWMEE